MNGTTGPMIKVGLGPVGRGDLILVHDGDAWTMAVLDVIERGHDTAWVGDRPLLAEFDRDVVVFRGSFRRGAGTLVGRRFPDPVAAGLALEPYRIEGEP